MNNESKSGYWAKMAVGDELLLNAYEFSAKQLLGSMNTIDESLTKFIKWFLSFESEKYEMQLVTGDLYHSLNHRLIDVSDIKVIAGLLKNIEKILSRWDSVSIEDCVIRYGDALEFSASALENYMVAKEPMSPEYSESITKELKEESRRKTELYNEQIIIAILNSDDQHVINFMNSFYRREDISALNITKGSGTDICAHGERKETDKISFLVRWAVGIKRVISRAGWEKDEVLIVYSGTVFVHTKWLKEIMLPEDE